MCPAIPLRPMWIRGAYTRASRRLSAECRSPIRRTIRCRRVGIGGSARGSRCWDRSPGLKRWTWLRTTAAVDWGNQASNPFRYSTDKGPADFDLERRFVTSFLWEMPFFRGAKGWQRSVLGGWQLNGILTLQSWASFQRSSGDGPPAWWGVGADRADVTAQRIRSTAPIGRPRCRSFSIRRLLAAGAGHVRHVQPQFFVWAGDGEFRRGAFQTVRYYRAKTVRAAVGDFQFVEPAEFSESGQWVYESPVGKTDRGTRSAHHAGGGEVLLLEVKLQSQLDVALPLRAGDLAERQAGHVNVRRIEMRRIGQVKNSALNSIRLDSIGILFCSDRSKFCKPAPRSTPIPELPRVLATGC